MKTYSLFLSLFATVLSFACAQNPTPKKVQISDDIELHYIEKGKGEPIIFVHGLCSDYSFWTRQLDGFAKQGYRAISYSRRYNYPNKNKIGKDHSAIVEAEDLAAFIKKLGIKKANVVGFSYGAYTTFMLALKHPELVQTITLAEPPIAPWLADLPGDDAEAGKAQLKKLIEQGVKPTQAAFAAGDNDLALQSMMDAIGGKGLFQNLPEFVKEKSRQNINELKAFSISKDRYPDVDREEVRKLSVPTLIISGEKSIATSRFSDPELMRLIPEKFREQVIMKDATHIMWVEQPVKCRQLVLKFIKENRD